MCGGELVEFSEIRIGQRLDTGDFLIGGIRQQRDARVRHQDLCGVLLGNVCEDKQGVWVSAEVALRGETDRQGGTHVTYTHQTWEKIYRVKEQQHPKLSILGWYHTHPRMGVFMSRYDTWLHENFFKNHWQVALVIEPFTATGGFFIPDVDGQMNPRQYSGFYEIVNQRNRSVVHWGNLSAVDRAKMEVVSNE